MPCDGATIKVTDYPEYMDFLKEHPELRFPEFYWIEKRNNTSARWTKNFGFVNASSGGLRLSAGYTYYNTGISYKPEKSINFKIVTSPGDVKNF